MFVAEAKSPVNLCKPNPCMNQGVCILGPGSYRCECHGWEGPHCESSKDQQMESQQMSSVLPSPCEQFPHLHLSLEQRCGCNSWTAIWWLGLGADVASVTWKVERFGLLRGTRAPLSKFTVRGPQEGLMILVIFFHSVLFLFSFCPARRNEPSLTPSVESSGSLLMGGSCLCWSVTLYCFQCFPWCKSLSIAFLLFSRGAMARRW